jgi:hypothetical protein
MASVLSTTFITPVSKKELGSSISPSYREFVVGRHSSFLDLLGRRGLTLPSHCFVVFVFVVISGPILCKHACFYSRACLQACTYSLQGLSHSTCVRL